MAASLNTLDQNCIVVTQEQITQIPDICGGIAWHPNGNCLAVYDHKLGSKETNICIYNVKENRVENKLNLCQGEAANMEWNKDGTLLAMRIDGVALVWNCHENIKKRTPAEVDVGQLKWNTAGNLLLTAGTWSEKCIIWNCATMEPVQQFTLDGGLYQLAWQSEDTFAIAMKNSQIQIFQIGIEKPILSMFGHTARISLLEWNEEGKLLASVSADMTLKVWSMDSEQCMSGWEKTKKHGRTVVNVKWIESGSNQLKLHQSRSNQVKSYQSSSNQLKLVTLSFNEIRIWGLKGELLKVHDIEAICVPTISLDGHLALLGNEIRCTLTNKIKMKLPFKKESSHPRKAFNKYHTKLVVYRYFEDNRILGIVDLETIAVNGGNILNN